jgi:hypothetical protein
MGKSGPKPKPTKAQVELRTLEILRIRLDGAEIWDVREYVREKEQEQGSVWELPPDAKPMSDSQLWRYLARADKLIAESCRASRKKLFRRHLTQRRNLYAKALSQGDVRAALACVADEAKLLGLYASVKIAPTNPKGDQAYVPLTDEERAAALARLYAALGQGSGSAATGQQAGGDGPILGGPGARADGRGDDPGPLAGQPPAGALDAGASPLFPAGGQEPGGRAAGVG